MKRIIAIIIFALFLVTLPAELAKAESVMRDITAACSIELNGSALNAKLMDGMESTYDKYKNAVINVSANEPIGGVYIKFDRVPPAWTLTAGNMLKSCGTFGFLHEFQRIDTHSASSISLSFEQEVSIADIFVFSLGSKPPSNVQVWRPAEGNCDIMLLPAHSDDDQLFFAGSVPDAVARGAEMQVCFFTNHWNTHSRPHEVLNSLWTCGLTRYPVIGPFTDTAKGYSEQQGLEIFAKLGFSYEDMVAHQVELLRKFKPQIVLAHDINGEYGHSAHILDSHSLRDAVSAANDPLLYTESAQKYGTWDVPKTYIHLYENNGIDFEIDKPLSYFDGKTAYQVSQDAFKCHISQMGTRYRTWLLGSSDAPVTNSHGFANYSPRYYGLWRTTVGEDSVKADFYENITLGGIVELQSAPTAHSMTTLAPSDAPAPTPSANNEPTPAPEESATPNITQNNAAGRTADAFASPRQNAESANGGRQHRLRPIAALATGGAGALAAIIMLRRKAHK